MSNYGYCPVCKEYDNLHGDFMRHRCKPAWAVCR
jgi:hypothetical protein